MDSRPMTIKECYEKYKDTQVAVLADSCEGFTHDLWLVIKAHKDDEDELARLRKIAEAAESCYVKYYLDERFVAPRMLVEALKEAGYPK